MHANMYAHSQTRAHTHPHTHAHARTRTCKMKHNVESMKSEMDTLVGNMNAIAESSDSVNSSLADKRKKIDKLVRVRRLLKVGSSRQTPYR